MLCSHKRFSTVCVQRVLGATRRLGYPRHVVDAFPLPCETKWKNVQPKILHDEVGGLGPKKNVHILKPVHHCSAPLAWSGLVQRMLGKLPMLNTHTLC